MTRLDIDPRFAAAHYQDGRDLRGEQQPSVHSVVGVGLPLNAVRTTCEGWIPVSERMPELGTDCLVWVDASTSGAFAKVDRWDEQHEAPVSWSSATIPIGPGWDDSDYEDITHWMPLPAPPSQLGGVSVPPEVAGQRQSQDHPESCGSTQPAAVPAYQPMTDEEIATAWDRAVFGRDSLRDAISFARAIESAVLARVAAAPEAAPVTQDEREACAKWLVSYWRQKGFGERLTDAEMMAGHERSGQLEVASAAWSAAIRAAAPAAAPVAWVRYCSDGTIEGPILDGDRRMDEVRKKSGAWTPLVAAAPAAAPAQDSWASTQVELEAVSREMDVIYERWPGKDGRKQREELLPSLRERCREIGMRRYALAAAPAAVQPPTDDALWDKTLEERDRYHDMADRLADAIARHFGIDIGEHTAGAGANDPWENALTHIEDATAAAVQPVAQSDNLEWLLGPMDQTIDVQPVAQQQPSVHQVAGVGLPSQAVRTGGQGADL